MAGVQILPILEILANINIKSHQSVLEVMAVIGLFRIRCVLISCTDPVPCEVWSITLINKAGSLPAALCSQWWITSSSSTRGIPFDIRMRFSKQHYQENPFLYQKEAAIYWKPTWATHAEDMEEFGHFWWWKEVTVILMKMNIDDTWQMFWTVLQKSWKCEKMVCCFPTGTRY